MSRFYYKGIPVWDVVMKNTRTGEKMNLEVTGVTNEEATGKCSNLFNYDGIYQWMGTGPLYEERINDKKTGIKLDKKKNTGEKYYQLFRYENNAVGGSFEYCKEEELEKLGEIFKPDKIEEITKEIYEVEMESQQRKAMFIMTAYPKNEYKIDTFGQDEWEAEI